MIFKFLKCFHFTPEGHNKRIVQKLVPVLVFSCKPFNDCPYNLCNLQVGLPLGEEEHHWVLTVYRTVYGNTAFPSSVSGRPWSTPGTINYECSQIPEVIRRLLRSDPPELTPPPPLRRPEHQAQRVTPTSPSKQPTRGQLARHVNSHVIWAAGSMGKYKHVLFSVYTDSTRMSVCTYALAMCAECWGLRAKC